jgi:hypothetical protein
MGAWLRLLLVVAHLGAIAFPCPEPALAAAARARTAERHAPGPRPPAPPRAPTSELHALCHCGCEEAPPATRAASLSVALLPAARLPSLPRATHTEAPLLALPSVPTHAPEPVPRPA